MITHGEIEMRGKDLTVEEILAEIKLVEYEKECLECLEQALEKLLNEKGETLG